MKLLLPNKSMLWQYGLSFFLVLILPLMGICAYFVTTLNHAITEKSLNERQQQTNDIYTNLTEEFDNIVSSAYRLSTAAGISRYKMENIPKYGLPIISTLREVRLESKLIDAVYLYHPQEEYAYSDTSSYTRSRLWAELHPGEVVDAQKLQQFHAQLSKYDGGPSLAVDEKSIFLYFPYPVAEVHSETQLIYRIDRETIIKMLKEQIGDPNITVALYGKNNELIAFSGELTPDNLAELKTKAPMDGAENLYSVQEKDNRGYTLYQAELPSVQMHCILIASEDEIVSIVLDSQWQMTFVILIVLICGGALAFLFTHAAYQPVRRLKSSAKELSFGIEGTGQNEFADIQMVIESLHTSVINLENLSGVNQKALKQYLILRLIHGMISDDNSYRDAFRRLGIFTEDGYCFTVVCYFPERKESGIQADVCVDYLENKSGDDVTICATVGPEHNQITMVCMTDVEDASSLLPFFDKLRLEVSNQFSAEAVICIGLAYSSLNYLSTSYIQAISTYAHRSIADKNDVMLFSAENLNYEIDIQYRNLLTLLGNAIQDWNQEGITSSLEYILDFARRDGISVQKTYMLCYNIIELASTAFYSFKYDRQSEFNSKYNLIRITTVDTMAEFEDFIQEIKLDICSIVSLDARSRLEGEPDEARQDLLTKMQEYLDSNIGNHQFSVAGMATDFFLSTSYLSRLYKEQTGETILEYVNRKRIERVKMLLTETDETVEAIVSAVGYYDVSSFIRKFKRLVGVTPGEFRNVSKK